MNDRREDFRRRYKELKINKMKEENEAKQLYQNTMLKIKTDYLEQYSVVGKEETEYYDQRAALSRNLELERYKSLLEPASPVDSRRDSGGK